MPALFLFGFWIFISRRMASRMGGGGLLAIGKSKAKVYVETDVKTASPTWPAWTRPRPS